MNHLGKYQQTKGSGAIGKTNKYLHRKFLEREVKINIDDINYFRFQSLLLFAQWIQSKALSLPGCLIRKVS